MEINLTGQTARILGDDNRVSASLRDKLTANGATLVAGGAPDLLILSAPLLPESVFDWDGLAATACEMGAVMQTRGAGRIVFLLPACADLPVRRQPDLSMRSAALLAVVRTLAMSLAPQIAVNALGLGAIGDGADLISGDAAMIGHASVGRAGRVAEACNVALFLSDPDNNYLTGQFLSADGGWAAGYGRSF